MAYQSKWDARRGDILKIAEQVKIDRPDAWEELKVHGQKSRKYINLVSMACILAGIPAGVNLKRGGPQESIDALALPNDSGAPDSTGKYLGVEIIDIVGGAEGPTPSLTWGDVTQITIDTGNKGGWKAGSLAASAPPTQPSPTLKLREQFYWELGQVNGFYASPAGLNRPGGMVKFDEHGRAIADVEALGAWGFDLMLGATVQECIKRIRQSEEWRGKHPNETP